MIRKKMAMFNYHLKENIKKKYQGFWWFAYDVIKNMIMQIMIDLSQILIWPIRP